MKLISEFTEDNVKVLVEDVEGGKKNYFIEGVYGQAETPNKNNRYYSKSILEHAVTDYVNTYVSQRRAMGELGHPQGPKINLDRVSHVIESLEWKGNDVLGRAKLIPTPFGKIAMNLVDEGIKLGVSTRGLGSLKRIQEGLDAVQKDFRMKAVDIVADPSAPSAFVNGIMEGVEYFVADNGLLQEQTIAEIKKKRLDEERALEIFAHFLNEISNRK